MGEDAGALGDKAPAGLGDAVSGGDGAGGKQAAVAEQMLPHSVEAAAGGALILLLKRGDEVLKEEIQLKILIL